VCKGFWWGNLRERDHVGEPSINGRIILEWILRKWGMRVRTGSGKGQVMGTCEYGNKPSGSVKCGEFID
jgi:hypothetical protein